MATITTVLEVPYLCSNYSRNIVLVYKVGHSITYFLGLDGCTLTAQKQHTAEFEREYEPWEKNTVKQFAERYTQESKARTMIGLTGAAHRVLRAILSDQSTQDVDYPQSTEKEFDMAKKEVAPTEGFRKPDGAVAQVHSFLDKKLDQIKAQTVSRKELIDAMVEKGLNQSTVVTQCGVWARTNGVTFARPTQAAEAKTTARKTSAAKAKAAKAKA